MAFTLAMSFGICVEDIVTVLEEYRLRVLDTRGLSFFQLAEDLIGDIDHDRVAQAALDGGCDIDAQTASAHVEIHQILVELGVLEF